MSKEYGLKFGSGALANTSGLAPTFIHFVRLDTGATLAGPGITQIIPGIGMYKFNYTPSFPIYFEVDGATTGLGSDRYITGILDPIDQIDALNAQLGATNQAIGATLFAIGTTNFAIGTSLTAQGVTLFALGTSNLAIGTTLTAIGTSLAAQGVTLIGYVSSLSFDTAAIQAAIGTTASSFGDNVTDPATLYGYLKRLQELQEGNSNYTKASGVWELYSRGSSTLLRSKTLAETVTNVTKT